MNKLEEIKEDICRLRDPQNDGWIDKILLKLDELQLFVVLGEATQRYLKSSGSAMSLKELYEIDNKIREME